MLHQHGGKKMHPEVSGSWCAGGSRLSAKERAMIGGDASSRRTKERSEKCPVIPGICRDSGGWGWGWQSEPMLGHRNDVEFCTLVHSSSLQDGTKWMAVWEEEARGWSWPQSQQEKLGELMQPRGSGASNARAPAAQAQHTHKCLLRSHMRNDLYASMSTWRKVSSNVSHGLIFYQWLGLKIYKSPGFFVLFSPSSRHKCFSLLPYSQYYCHFNGSIIQNADGPVFLMPPRRTWKSKLRK